MDAGRKMNTVETVAANAFRYPKAATMIEERVGRDINAAVKKEGHKGILPPSMPKPNHTTEEDNIRLMIRRFVQQHHGCTIMDIKKAMNMTRDEATNHASKAVIRRSINVRIISGKRYYYCGAFQGLPTKPYELG